MAAIMLAIRLGGALYYMERNRAMWTADDQYRWNGFLSVVNGSCPIAVQCSATESTSDVGQIQKRIGEFRRQVVWWH